MGATLSKHVAIIGAGVVGLCAADSLTKRGYRVTVVDKDAKTGDGCSYGNGGIVVPSHFVPLAAPGMIEMGLRMMRDRKSPFGIERLTDLQLLAWCARFARSATKSHVDRTAPLIRDLNLSSRKRYEEMVSELGVETGFAHRGLLMLCQKPATLDAEAELVEHAHRLGLNAEVLDKRGLEEIEPDVRMNVHGSVYFADDAHLSPSAFMGALRRKLIAAGVTFREAVSVEGFVRSGSRVERLIFSDGDLSVDEVVLSAGAWSGELASKLGSRVPMVAGRGYGFTSANAPETPRRAAILVEGRVAVTPMPEGVRFVGTMEIARPKVVANSPRVDGMRASIQDVYPSFKKEHLSGDVWCGLRPCSPDGLPYMGRLQKAPNVVMASGHAMMGMSLGPISGDLVAQVISGEKPSLPLDLLSPDRYA